MDKMNTLKNMIGAAGLDIDCIHYPHLCITTASMRKRVRITKAKDHGHWVRDRVQAIRPHTRKSEFYRLQR